MKIAVITTATLDLNFRDYIIDNSLEYCGKHGYTFMVYENKIDEGASVIANKTMTALRNIDNYDWIFMKDADSLFYRFDIKIENFIDGNYNYIASHSCIPNTINLGHMLIRCTPQVKKELELIYEEIRQNVIVKGEQPIYNDYWNTGKISPVKKLPKSILNAQPFDKIKCGEWHMTIEELQELDAENRNFEALSDITGNTFIVHYPGAFLKSRSYLHERMVHSTNTNWFNFSEDYLPKFIEMYNNIKKTNQGIISEKQPSHEIPIKVITNEKKLKKILLKPRVMKTERRKIKYKNR